MIQSMTGYGKAEKKLDNKRLVVEIKSKLYYYPVALSKQLRKNTDNLVNIKLVGLGNTLEEGPFN